MEHILVDECLSQGLVALAKARGLQADHVAWFGKSGTQDWNLVPYAIERDYTLVTNNRRDFLKEYARLPVHNGLVIVVPMVERDSQIRLFGLVLDFLANLPDTGNKLVEIFSGGEIRMREWSTAGNDPGYVQSPSRPA